MPRTKVKRSTITQKNKTKEEVSSIVVKLEETKKTILDEIDKKLKTTLEAIEQNHFQIILNIPKKYLNMKMCEINKIESFSTTTMLKESTFNNLQMKSTTKRKTRNLSYTNDDEGYLTTDSGSGSRASRSKSKTTMKNTRTTRSLSRTEKTPINKTTPDSYGLITPKVKPNTPLVLVRRPKVGEMVLSVQGSPLLGAPGESKANINIPLVDGTLLSLQAQVGLRKSQIPELDPEVKRQLQILKQNLDIMIPHKN